MQYYSFPVDCTGIQVQTNQFILFLMLSLFYSFPQALEHPQISIYSLPFPWLVFHSCLHLHQVKVMQLENLTTVILDHVHFGIFTWQERRTKANTKKMIAPLHHNSLRFHNLLTISRASLWVTSASLSNLCNVLPPSAWASLGLLQVLCFCSSSLPEFTWITETRRVRFVLFLLKNGLIFTFFPPSQLQEAY